MNTFDLKKEIEKIGLSQSEYEDCMKTIIDKRKGLVDLDWQEICDKYNLNYNKDTLRKANTTVFGGAFVAQYFEKFVVTKYFEKFVKQIAEDFDDSKFKNEDDSVDKITPKKVDKLAEKIKNLDNNYYYKNETSINKDGTYSSNKIIEMTEEQSKDVNYILKVHGFDPCVWKLVSARNNIREAISKEDGIVTLYASFITVKPLEQNEIPLAMYQKFFDNLDRQYSKVQDNNVLNKAISSNYLNGNKMLLIDIADLHLNLQATMFTTNNEYNCEIAENLFFYVLNDIVQRTKQHHFKEIIFCVGGDMLNGDNLTGSTTKGTAQDSDIHYYDAYEKLCSMTIRAIDFLKENCNCLIKVIYVAGNHDEVTGFKLAKYIDAWFRNDEYVVVDYNPLMRKYEKFGKTLLCFAHDGNEKKLPQIIADEAREYWSQVDTVEVFLQHFHTEKVLLEENNIRIQRLPTISAKSRWSTNKGYNSKRQCKSFIFDLEDGLTDVIYTPIKMNK